MRPRDAIADLVLIEELVDGIRQGDGGLVPSSQNEGQLGFLPVECLQQYLSLRGRFALFDPDLSLDARHGDR